MTKCLNCGAVQGPFSDPDGFGKMCSSNKSATPKEREQRIRECNKRREAWYGN